MLVKALRASQPLPLLPVCFVCNVIWSCRRCAYFSKGSQKKTAVITQEIVDHLERVSLVDFANKKGIERLQSAIEFADRISHVNTNDVEPMVSVLKDRSIYLRNDQVVDVHCRESVMTNAAVVEEEYFVAPPGNIPVTPSRPILEEHRNTV
ncbi:glutamyl-tRNA(Gln) amidotransferase subunit C, mitochondrial [Hetaerina americana]|uniref:glutamyl-tRNA(Gln) amidotransferase subunit C, mitochondrial n=1 Tax=Hetaerina americana TaxID=62018 RepID=UPI003A7F4F22